MDDSSCIDIPDSEDDTGDQSIHQMLTGMVNNNLIGPFSLLGRDLFDSLPNVSKRFIASGRGSSLDSQPLVYIGNGYYKPSRIIKSCYVMSIDNLHRWYLMTKKPSNINPIIDNEKITNSLVSNVYYPLDPDKPSGDPICDFSIQYIHPSIRKYLFTANEPSYYYLFKESINKSETSSLAKALLSADNYRKKSKIEEKSFQEDDSTNEDSLSYEDNLSGMNDFSEINNHPKNLTMPYSDSSIGISMCPGGFLFPYHLGVLSLFSEHNIVNITTPLAGSSAGALAAVSAGMGANFYQIMTITESISEDFRLHGIKHRLNQSLYRILNAIIPSDSPEFLNNRIGSITCCCTLLTPIPKALYTSEYYDKNDLIQCVVASSNIPMYSGKSPTVKFRGSRCIDGLFSSRRTLGSPPTGSKRDIVISSFHALKVGIKTGLNDCVSPHLAGLDSLIEQFLRLKSLQKRFLYIKYNLKSDCDEWKAFVQEAQMLYKRISDLNENSDKEGDIELQTHDLIVLSKHMNSNQIQLFKQVLRDSQITNKLNLSYGVFMDFRKKIAFNPLTSDAIRHFMAKFSLSEWLSLELESLNYRMVQSTVSDAGPIKSQFSCISSFEDEISSNEDSFFDNFESYIKGENEKTTLESGYLGKRDSVNWEKKLRGNIKRLRIIINCITTFLCCIFPPNNFSYYYTNSCTLLTNDMSPSQMYKFALKGSCLEDVRQIFDQGRADAYRWIILEYILLENHLYTRLEEYKNVLSKLEGLMNPSELNVIPPKETSEFKFDFKWFKKRVKNKNSKKLFYNIGKKMDNESVNILTEQINYINDVLGPPEEFEIINEEVEGNIDLNKEYLTLFKNFDNSNDQNINEGLNKSQDVDFLECLFKIQNSVIKQAIRLKLLNNSELIHILGHTNHWINSSKP